MNIKHLLEFEGGSQSLGLYTRGHFPEEEFAAELRSAWDEPSAKAEDVRQTYYRNVPCGVWGDGWRFIETDTPGKGAYKVTVWERPA